jgi:DNA-directed RNA polymerase subunit M/transcription elongation factor TFIIS
MAKKKTAIPTKKCPKCENAVHVAVRTCPQCGEAFPMKKRRKKARAEKGAAPQAAADSPLVNAANFVRQAGGIDQAQQALKDLAKVAKALG